MEHTGPRGEERGGGGVAYFSSLDLLFQPLPRPPPPHPLLLLLVCPPFPSFCLLSCFSSYSLHENQKTRTNPPVVGCSISCCEDTDSSIGSTVLALTPEVPPTSASIFTPSAEPDDIIIIITAALGSQSLLITAHVVLPAVNHQAGALQQEEVSDVADQHSPFSETRLPTFFLLIFVLPGDCLSPTGC